MPQRYVPLFANPFVALHCTTDDNDLSTVNAIAVIRVEDGEIVARELRRVLSPPGLCTPTTLDQPRGRSRRKPAPDAVGFVEAWASLAPTFQGARLIAAHMAGIKRKVFAACQRRFGMEPLPLRLSCTLLLGRMRWGLRVGRATKMASQIGHFTARRGVLAEAEACAHIALAAMRRDATGAWPMVGWRPSRSAARVPTSSPRRLP